MKKKILVFLSCVCILLVCVCAIIACRNECAHNYENGVCTKCNEPDPNYTQPKIDYDMSGVKFQDKTVVFNGQAQTITVTGTLPSGLTVKYDYYSDGSRTTKVTEARLPGTYYVTASFTGDDKHNKPADMQATFIINNADYDMSGVQFENKVVPFNGQAQTIAVTGTLPEGVTVAYKYYSDSAYTTEVAASNVVNKGVYYALATFTGAEGYNDPSVMSATLTITGLNLGNVTFADKTVAYDGEVQNLVLTGTLNDGLTVAYKYYSDEACTTEVEAANVKNAGTYYVQAIITDADEKTETLTATLTITPIDVEGISLGNNEYDYNGEAQGMTIMGTLPEGVTVEYKFYSDKDCTTEVAASNVKNAGTYYVRAIFTVNGNYNQLNPKTAVLTINKIDVNTEGLVFEDATKDYTGEPLTMSVTTASGELPEGITEVKYEYYSDANCTAKVEDANVKNVGVYYAKATFVVDGNHKAVKELFAVLTVKGAAFEDITEDDVEIVVTATHAGAEDPVSAVVENGAYTFEYNPGKKYELAVGASVQGKTLKTSIQYFDTMNGNGELSGNIGKLTRPTLENFADVLYAQITLYDDTHEMTVVATLKLRKLVVVMNTFEDLKIMRDHIYGNEEKGIYPVSTINRKGISYQLGQDIDCQGQLWTPVTYILDLSQGGGTGYVDSSFCSEFDGKGHTISNYRITEESFDADAINALDAGVRILHVGFFGRVNAGIMYNGTSKSDIELEIEACNIHDVTFSDVTIKLDAKSEDYNFEANTAIYAGFVTGYLDSGNWHTVGRTNLYNITVENSTIEIDAYKTYAGGIIGFEDIAPNYAGLRKNLTVRDCAIYAVSSQGVGGVDEEGKDITKVYIGGLVGRWTGSVSVTPDNDPDVAAYGGITWWTRYNDCTVENIKLGYNLEAWLAANEQIKALQEQEETDERNEQIAALEAERDGYLHVMGGNIRVGVFFGSLEDMNVTFKNCSVTNYLIAHTSPSTFGTGVYGRGSNNKFLVNTTITDGDWNNGLHGVYGVPNDEGEVTKQEINTGNLEELWKWENFSWAAEVNTETLDKKEGIAMQYLGLVD